MTMIFVAANLAAEVSSLPEETPLGVLFLHRIKRAAKKQNPRFRPFKLENEREYFILLLGKSEMDELKNDPTLKQVNDQDFRTREHYIDNILFMNHDWIYNGILLREISVPNMADWKHTG
jgi:hypothetical protein